MREQEQRHRDFHMIGDTIRRGRPSTAECPACTEQAVGPAPDAAGPTTDEREG